MLNPETNVGKEIIKKTIFQENQQPILGVQRFSEEKWQFSLDVKQKTHTLLKNIDETKCSLRSALLTIIILLE